MEQNCEITSLGKHIEIFNFFTRLKNSKEYKLCRKLYDYINKFNLFSFLSNSLSSLKLVNNFSEIADIAC